MDEAIRKMVESIESIAPHVWSLMVRQAQIDAWLSVLWLVVWIAIAVGYGITLRLWFRKYRASGESEFILWDGSIGFILTTLFVGIAILIVIPLSLTSAVQGFANPEYVAIKKLLALVP